MKSPWEKLIMINLVYWLNKIINAIRLVNTKKKKKKLYGPFLLWMGFNCLKATATSRRQFTFYHSVPRNSWQRKLENNVAVDKIFHWKINLAFLRTTNSFALDSPITNWLRTLVCWDLPPFLISENWWNIVYAL